MKKCSVCGAPIGDTDLTCPTCRCRNTNLDKPDLSFYPFQKSTLASATCEEMGFMIVVDALFIGLICFIAFVF